MLRAGLVRLDPRASTIVDVVVFQYNPDSVTRTIQPRAIGGEPGDRLEVLRLTGPPHETFKFDAEIDATDQLEHVGNGSTAPDEQKLVDAVAREGLLPSMAVLERLVTPTVTELLEVDALFDRGMLEVAPRESPLTVLVWGAKRVVPVQVASLTLTEEAFDPNLHPIRVKASFECKVLTSSDLPLQHLGGSLYIGYRKTIEQLAMLITSRDPRPLGVEHLP
jgi:hypothetical protein